MSIKHASTPEVEDFLIHYGVKGMRWGHRKAEDSGGGGGGSSRAAAPVKKKGSIGERLNSAATRVQERDARIEKARLNLEKQQNAIAGAKRQMKADTRVFTAERRAGRNDIRNMKLDLLSHPDAATANRMTSGEMFSNVLFGGGTDAVLINKRQSDLMARRQATGYYQAKKRPTKTRS